MNIEKKIDNIIHLTYYMLRKREIMNIKLEDLFEIFKQLEKLEERLDNFLGGK